MIIPIGLEDQTVRRIPWVTVGIMIACTAVLIITSYLGSSSPAALEEQLGGLVEYLVDRPYLELSDESQATIKDVVDTQIWDAFMAEIRQDHAALPGPFQLAIEQEELVKLALRHRPDALTLGEARGAEVFDLLNALNTGHKNGLTSLHAYGVDELFSRIYLMLAQSDRGRFLDSYRAANLVAQTLHVAISMELVGRDRRIGTIAELTGEVAQKGTSFEPKMVPIFQHTGAGGKLDGPLNDSRHTRIFEQARIPSQVYTQG